MKLPKPAGAPTEFGQRPKRGSPEQTRARIVMAAAEEFQTHGYFGTDSNVIARAAGYAPGTFYKHFVDKRAVFLAVYVDWVTAQWAEIAKLLRDDLPGPSLAAQIADLVLAHHKTWRVFRSSLKALIATDAEVRKYHRAWRRRQLRLLGEVLGRPSQPEDALGVLVIEHIADALADGEAAAIGVPREVGREYLISQLADTLGRRPRANSDIAPASRQM